jgi:predicted nuclease with TOPRIM domain
MTEYNFEYETLQDRISYLENEVERLKEELTETDNTIYEILNRLDSLDGMSYSSQRFKWN